MKTAAKQCPPAWRDRLSMPCFYFMRNFCFFQSSVWRLNVLSKCLSPVGTPRNGTLGERRDSDERVCVSLVEIFCRGPAPTAQTEAPAINPERPFSLNLAGLGVHLSLRLAVCFLPRVAIWCMPPPPLDFWLLAKAGDTTRGLDPVRSWRALPMSDQPRNCGASGVTSSGNEFISS